MKKKSEDFYLKKVHLKGYKSIKDVEVELENGLNIIIGKNASGKTNFVTFLNDLNKENLSNYSSFESKLIFSNDLSIHYSKTNPKKDDLKDIIFEKIEESIDIKVNKNNITNSLSVELMNYKTINRNFLIKYGIPKNIDIIENSISFSANIDGHSMDLLKMLNKNRLKLFFIHWILLDIYTDFSHLNKDDIINSVQTIFLKTRQNVNYVKEFLVKYSPIKDFRFSKNINIFYEQIKETITVNNLFFEYKIDNEWMPYSNLSDGTKRLLYLISEIAYVNNYLSSLSIVENVNLTILLEEPELGIHPHQLINLMKFIKEMSRDKQIIITTHSPLVLDILEKDELNKIIIAYTENDNKGTKLRHLNRNEITKAQMYMEEDYLSDYWKYSDLEK